MASKEEERRLNGKISILKRPDGSCEVERGRAKIWCAINGPGDIQSSKRSFERVNIQFDINRLPSLSDKLDVSKCGNLPSTSNITDKFITDVVENAIDISAYPRTCLQICSQEIKADSSMDSLLLNGFCLALLDCGIRLKHVFCAVSVCKKQDAGFIVEPSVMDLVAARSLFTFVFKPSLTDIGGGSVIASDASGLFSSSDYEGALQVARGECMAIFDFYRRQVYEKFGCSLKM